MIGGHFIKGWSRTRNHVTLSSAEADLMALVKCSAELLGLRSMLGDFGVESEGVVYAISSAGFAIARRKGAGQMQHINVKRGRMRRTSNSERSWGRRTPQI